MAYFIDLFSPETYEAFARYACLGEKDAAFGWLEKAFQEHTQFLAYFKIHPLFDNLHGDPRFDDLVKRIGIPD